ncbi:hypothetical protein [Herbidospora sp. NBRC 101105]|uniref:hypothetical protein n=1 Tax=Herbidospora sp. NBRC 101105 TaxID=3032195 RepID=UPI0024A12BE2|nr:hypothetical protein Hesp01_75440 [Herbidospora sp. NBRC 101105]
MRIMLGLVRHDSGSVRVLGCGPGEALGRIGAILESSHFVPHLSGRVNLQVLARARGLTDAAVDRVLHVVDLDGARTGRSPATRSGCDSGSGWPGRCWGAIPIC